MTFCNKLDPFTPENKSEYFLAKEKPTHTLISSTSVRY